MSSIADTASSLRRMEPLRKPVMQAVIDSLDLPEGSRGLDAGCGIGLQAQLLAQAVGARGHVTVLDACVPFLEIARCADQPVGRCAQIEPTAGRWDQLPFDDRTFDWIWSMDAAGYAPGEPVSVIRELARVIRPGGRLVIGYWSSQYLLAGYPALEARLNASQAGIAPFRGDAPPPAHYLYTLDWMRQAGLVENRAETFAHTIHAPLAPEVREALADLLAMRWSAAGSELPSEDWRAYQHLCQAGSPEFIADQPGYCAFFTYTVFSGRVS